MAVGRGGFTPPCLWQCSWKVGLKWRLAGHHAELGLGTPVAGIPLCCCVPLGWE